MKPKSIVAMKKLPVLLLALAVLTSCATQKMLYVKDVSFFDYKSYWDEGFFITESPSVSFDYIPIGAITARTQDGYNVAKQKEKAKERSSWSNLSSAKYSDNMTLFTLRDAVDLAVEMAKENGADGLINVSVDIKEVTVSKQTTYGSGSTNLGSGYSYVVKGMAIKRK